MKSDVFELLTKRLAFLVMELKKIAKLSRSLFNHLFLELSAYNFD
jgi:hypothetical protein